jgi:hypothetical protein
MKKFGKFVPDWREDVPADNSYRSVYMFDPKRFKHPSNAWYDMFKQEFGLTDDDFKTEDQPGTNPSGWIANPR